jgi:hypothetical protein
MSLSYIHLGMTLSVIAFSIGYFFRVKNNAIHVVANLTGTGFNLVTAIYLLIIKYGLGGLEHFGIEYAVSPWIVHTHRAFAATTLLLMLLMAYLGVTRNREWHIKLHKPFIVLYLAVYISGLFIFKTIEG